MIAQPIEWAGLGFGIWSQKRLWIAGCYLGQSIEPEEQIARLVGDVVARDGNQVQTLALPLLDLVRADVLERRGVGRAFGLGQHVGDAVVDLAKVWVAQAVADEKERAIQE